MHGMNMYCVTKASFVLYVHDMNTHNTAVLPPKVSTDMYFF